MGAYLEELSPALDRESFARITSRFDAQFLAKYKARFPAAAGKFPFGSAGKPYTLGQPYFQPQSNVSSQPPTARYPSDGKLQMYQPPQYSAPASFPVRMEQPYSAPMYERPMEYRPQTSYPTRGYSDNPYDSQPRFPDYSQAPQSYDRPQTSAGKSQLNSLSDYADLRKSKEELLNRYQTTVQRPPKA